MILADSSIWADHFRKADSLLARLLGDGAILIHDAIIGELAMGNLPRRAPTLADLSQLPHAVAASNSEVLRLVDTSHLYGTGIGYVDAHLLAATLLTPDALLWARDLRLRRAAERLGVAAPHN